ncbi:gp526 [Bacillus phage G]|uniref:Gp526 n=1 Tax=Bacillus phage G TaxID=2884420 RepID=G3MAR7_9CAUD|nr:gp526 [Bacillus phage G]AEO93784.1 gp526 [Bacillus phage G]
MVDKNKIIIPHLRNDVLNYLNEIVGFDKLPTRGMQFSGNYSCFITEKRTIYIVIPVVLDKSGQLYKIVNNVLKQKLNIDLSFCEILQNVLVNESKILEFQLPEKGMI